MDGIRFDDLVKRLGTRLSRRQGLRGAGAALAGLAGSASAGSVSAKRRGCRPRCTNGFSCESRQCVCASGLTCAGRCCAAGETCVGEACVPEPGCIAAGQPCKGTGLPCCGDRTCGSGQGGQDDVACYVPAGGPCQSTVECTYDSTCRDGACVANPPVNACPEAAFVPTGNAAADGATLRALLQAADTNTPTVIVLAAGAYAMPNFGWQYAEPLTIVACPDAAVTLTPDATYDPGHAFFDVRGAHVELERIAFTGGGAGSPGQGLRLSRSGNALLTLRQCTVRGFGTGVYVDKFLSATVIGGDYTGNDTSFDESDSLSGPPTYACSESPRAAHCCLNDDAIALACGCTSNCQ